MRGAKLAATRTGETCGALQLSPSFDGYTIVRLTTKRAGFSRSTFVYVARDESTQVPRVIGIWRE